MNRITEIHSLEEYMKALSKNSSNLIVVDFFAKWCGPCVAISPFLGDMSWKYPDVVFLKVDVDEVKEVARGAGVRAMPTFHFYRGGVKVGELVGASKDKLEELIIKHSASDEGSLQKLLASGQDLSDILTGTIRKIYQANPEPVANAALDALDTLLTNIVNDSKSPKFRKIRLENARFTQQIWGVPVAPLVLKYAGFKEGIEHGFLVLPENADLEALFILQALISSRKDPGSSFRSFAPPAQAPPGQRSAGQQPNRPVAQHPPQQQQQQLSADAAAALIASLASSFANIGPHVAPQTSEDPYLKLQRRYLQLWSQQVKETDQVRAMNQKLRSYLGQVLLYERPQYQQKALAVIPLAQLQERARAAMAPGGDMKEEVMRQLLRWFKGEFFTWTDQPKCHSCGEKTHFLQVVQGTPTEIQFGGSRVELYGCATCNLPARFPRYNDPAKLLETRTGRCGEWANAFTLCCRALGYDARYILDWTDHVWTEVWIESRRAWIHCDPSEAAYDTPMVYEAGWGKKLSYVLAFSCEEVVDVTRRYIRNHAEVAKRRREVPERALKKLVADLCVERRPAISPPRLEIILQRFLEEQAEMIKPRALQADEKIGRTSGALEWRQSRGETGSSGLNLPSLPAPRNLVFDLERPDSKERLRFLGCAAQILDEHTGERALQLTPKQNDQTGGVCLDDKVVVAQDFICEFSFVVRNAGADGFAFVIHNSPDGASSLGRGGSDLGYGGLKNSVAIEFDTFENVDRANDPNDNHISVHTRGQAENEAHHSASIACTGRDLLSLKSGNVLHVQILYAAQAHTLVVQLTEDLTKDYIPVLSVPLNLETTLALDGGKAWIAFTGATGGLSQEQLVFAWKFFQSQ